MSTISTHQRVQATRRILRDTSQTQERTKTTTQFPISTNTSSSLSPSTPKTNTNNFALPSNTTTPVQFDSSSVAVTALVLLSALFFLGFFSVYARRFFTNDQDDDYHTSNFHGRHGRYSSTISNNRRYLSSAPRGLDPTVIKTLPVVCFNTQKVTSSGDCERCGCCGCVVCLSEFDDGEIVKVIPCCGHLFHPQCIDSWLVAHASCPLCRSTELFGSVNRKIEDGGRGLLGSSVDTIGRHLVEECELVGVAVEGGRDEEEVVVSIGAEDQTQMSRVLLDDGHGGDGGLGRSRSWCCCTSAVEGEDKNIDELPRRSCSR